jgi:hypothetical protein
MQGRVSHCQIRDVGLPGLSESVAAGLLKDPIPVSEASDSDMSAKEDTRLRAAPTVRPFGTDYDGANCLRRRGGPILRRK